MILFRINISNCFLLQYGRRSLNRDPLNRDSNSYSFIYRITGYTYNFKKKLKHQIVHYILMVKLFLLNNLLTILL
jgi:hypothetical protein